MAPTDSTVSPHPLPRRGRRWRLAAVLGAIALAAAGAWLAGHAIPQSATFAARRGPVVGVTAGEEVTTPEGYVSQTVRLTASTGLFVDLRVLRPAGPETARPLVVLLAGHRTGRDAIDVVGNPGGIVVAALDYPYHGPERPRGVVQSLQAIPAIQDGLLDTPPAVSVALDWLLTQPWVDSTKVELMGVSLGVPFAAVAGALDERFRRVWLIHGGIDNRAWLANRLESRIGNPILRHSAASLLHLLAYGETFRLVRWVPRIAPRTVMVVGADADEQMPRSSVEKLHAAARPPKELLWSEGGHVDTHRMEIIRQIMNLVRSRIEPES
jgi:dienelactone hydrolase